jgi:hypothetical protein
LDASGIDVSCESTSNISTPKKTCYAAIAKKISCVTLSAALLFTVSLLIGCGSGENLPTQISGTWQRAEGDCNVQISLAAEPKTVTLDGHPYPATIDKVDMGVYSVHLKMETEPGQAEEWIIRQVWDDNGISFSLAFTHNGTREKLVNCGHSCRIAVDPSPSFNLGCKMIWGRSAS